VTSPRERLYVVSCAGMFVFGMILGLPGTVLGQPETVQQFGLTLADRGLLISTLFTGLLFGSLLSGVVVDALGQRASLVVSSALVALWLPLFATASSAVLAASALFALGLGSASINTASNALSSELFPDERGRRMNGIAIMVGLGGIAMPTATVLASHLVSWRAVVLGGAALAALVALSGVMPIALPPRNPVKGSDPITVLRQFARQPAFAIFLLLILLGGGNEASMAGWTSSFVIASGMSASTATWVLSSHWLGLILSRALFSNRVDRAKEIAVERSAVLSALVLLVLVVSPSPVVVMFGPFVVGMCMALVMPTSLALAGERIEGAHGLAPGTLRVEIQVETPQSILGPDGTALVARMLHAAPDRVVGLHYGTYDYSAFCGIAAPYQSMEHPVADHAKAVMQAAAAGTGVRLSDGSTNILPVGDAEQVLRGWALHLRLVRRSLERGFYQGWDLHPAQLPTRYAATYAFYRDGFAGAADRLHRYATRAEGGILDEPATARALADFLVRGLECGALVEADTRQASGMTIDELTALARPGRG